MDDDFRRLSGSRLISVDAVDGNMPIEEQFSRGIDDLVRETVGELEEKPLYLILAQEAGKTTLKALVDSAVGFVFGSYIYGGERGGIVGSIQGAMMGASRGVYDGYKRVQLSLQVKKKEADAQKQVRTELLGERDEYFHLSRQSRTDPNQNMEDNLATYGPTAILEGVLSSLPALPWTGFSLPALFSAVSIRFTSALLERMVSGLYKTSSTAARINEATDRYRADNADGSINVPYQSDLPPPRTTALMVREQVPPSFERGDSERLYRFGQGLPSDPHKSGFDPDADLRDEYSGEGFEANPFTGEFRYQDQQESNIRPPRSQRGNHDFSWNNDLRGDERFRNCQDAPRNYSSCEPENSGVEHGLEIAYQLEIELLERGEQSLPLLLSASTGKDDKKIS
ncbi:hypothetical protein HYT52_01895 [Candidatus Woesearchaeota archaeon]|nr:hypothetical protein [Candidatus Woesearchaeota archaeon]